MRKANSSGTKTDTAHTTAFFNPTPPYNLADEQLVTIAHNKTLHNDNLRDADTRSRTTDLMPKKYTIP
jgi:hypothetical protein